MLSGFSGEATAQARLMKPNAHVEFMQASYYVDHRFWKRDRSQGTAFGRGPQVNVNTIPMWAKSIEETAKDIAPEPVRHTNLNPIDKRGQVQSGRIRAGTFM